MDKSNLTITNDHGMWQVRYCDQVQYEMKTKTGAEIMLSQLEATLDAIVVHSRPLKMISEYVNEHYSERPVITYTLPSKMNDLWST